MPSGYVDPKRRHASRSRSVPREKDKDKRSKGKKEKKDKNHKDVDEERARKRSGRSRSRDDVKPTTSQARMRAASGHEAAAIEEAVLGRLRSSEFEEAPLVRRGTWREELEVDKGKGDADGDDGAIVGFDQAEDDEAEVKQKLAESRARREALIAKWVNRGEQLNGLVGPLETPETATGDIDPSDSEGDVSEDNRQDDATDKPLVEDAKLKKDLQRFILQHKAEHDNDMFDENADEEALKAAKTQSAVISLTGASADDWDDTEGYYKAKIGEMMTEKYLVVEDTCGKGVFSNVVKAKDQTDGSMVAIKVMRCNDMMLKAAEKEVEVLQRLNRADRGNKRFVIKLLRHFMYRGHLCLVFECMWDNLRMALKKYTKSKGMSLQAVRAYTRQLLIALRHIHRCHIIHADIKPDNILISAGHNVVKICDLGSAMDLTEVDTTPYLVSRFYRAPEIVLGSKYGVAIDVFALGCSLFELFTGKILFPGRSNNDMMKLFMEVKGKFSTKLIKSGQLWKQHFDENLDFQYLDTNKATRKKVTRTITDWTQKRQIVDMVMARVGTEKQKSSAPEDQLYCKKAKQFADLVEKMTAPDPERRIDPTDALQHPFLTEAFLGPKSKEAAAKAAAAKAAATKGGARK